MINLVDSSCCCFPESWLKPSFTFSSAKKEYFLKLTFSHHLHEQKLQWCLLHLRAIRAPGIWLPKQVDGSDELLSCRMGFTPFGPWFSFRQQAAGQLKHNAKEHRRPASLVCSSSDLQYAWRRMVRYMQFCVVDEDFGARCWPDEGELRLRLSYSV